MATAKGFVIMPVQRLQTVLVVEDNLDDLWFLKHALRKEGVEGSCRFVLDGAEATDYFKGEGAYSDRAANPFPDVVILDLILPNVDGFQVLSWMRGVPACEAVKVVVWSGWGFDGQVERAKLAGASEFVKKDMGPGHVSELIRLIWGRSSPGAGPDAPGVEIARSVAPGVSPEASRQRCSGEPA